MSASVFEVAPAGSDPPGALLAPRRPDGSVSLDDLPAGGDVAVLAPGTPEWTQAPRGARTVARHVDGDWVWRLLYGQGWALRQGKGPPRDSGIRPKLAILEPCTSVSLRATAMDGAFPVVGLHVAIIWVRLDRTGAWKVDSAHAWASEPAPDGTGRAWCRPPRELGLTACRALLSGAPELAALDALRTQHESTADDRGMTDD